MIKTIAIYTLGCSKNTVDSEYMAGYLEAEGYTIIEDTYSADAVIVNTCSFILDAKMESIDAITDLAEFKLSKPDLKIIVAGCLGERYAKELMDEVPEIDAIIGTAKYSDIVKLIKKLEARDDRAVLTGGLGAKFKPVHNRKISEKNHYAYMKIAEGCNNACAFCIIPKLKGPYVSRDVNSLVKEAKYLAKNGVKELILIAQDTSRYGYDFKDGTSLVNLLEKLCRIKDIVWIRMHYLYPDIVDETLLDFIAANPKVLPYFDIPLQHVSDRMLKKMKRTTSKAKILKLITMIRDKLPSSVIRSTFIVGFPGETEDDFAELMDFLKTFELDRVGVFKYSDEEGTSSYRMHGKVGEEEKVLRQGEAMELLEKLAIKRQSSRLSKIERVIVDEEYEDYYAARSYGDAPDVDGLCFIEKNAANDLEAGSFIDVRIVRADAHDVYGEVVR